MELNEKFPRREYKTTVVDVNGKTVFVTRYLKKLEPPPLVLEMADKEEKKTVSVTLLKIFINFTVPSKI